VERGLIYLLSNLLLYFFNFLHYHFYLRLPPLAIPLFLHVLLRREMALIARGNGDWPLAGEADDIQQRLLRRSTRQSKLTQYFKPDEKNDNGLPNDSVLNNDPVFNMSLTSASIDVVRSQPSIAEASTSKKRAASPMQASSSKKRAIALPQASNSIKRVAAPSQASRSKKRAASSLQPDAIEPPKKVRRVVKATKSVVKKTDERKEPCGKPLVWAEV
jgi:hypothetical protein